jgi:tetratricopeptide (TPR) repeat protein
VAEKLPLVALIPLFGVLTYAAQKKINAVASVDAIPAAQRIANASISYVGYIVKMFAPLRLAAFYTHPRAQVSYALAAACAAALLVATLAALSLGKQRRYVAVGWLWYVIALAPVIGLIQVGNQASADRYTYLPFVGLFLLLVWGAADLLKAWLTHPRVPATVLATIVVLAFAVRARAQVFTWRNSTTLFTTMVATSPDAAVGHYNLGKVWDDANRMDDAVASYRKAIELDPARADAWVNLGIDLHKRGDKDEALKAFLRADELKPGVASTQFNIGLEREALGQFPEALAAFDEARRLDPNLPAQQSAESFAYLALAYQNVRQFDKAATAYRKAIALNPALTICRYNLGVLALKAGDRSEAMEQLTALEGLDAKVASSLHELIEAHAGAEHP